MNFPTKLARACEVCGRSSVLLVQPMASQPKGATVYMCDHCKAVYRADGVRDTRYPSLYDADEPGPEFDAMHAQLTGRARIANASAPAKSLAPLHQAHLSRIGLVPFSLVEVRYGDGWVYAHAYDYNPVTNMLGVFRADAEVPEWYTPMDWRVSTQPLPLPVTAPPSPVKARAKVNAGYVRFGATPADALLKVWTYGSQRGQRMANAIYTYVSWPQASDHVALGRGIKAVKFINPVQDLVHVFECETGALLGTCGRSKTQPYTAMLKRLRADIRGSDAATLALQMDGARRVCAQAFELTESAFFSRRFELTTV